MRVGIASCVRVSVLQLGGRPGHLTEGRRTPLHPKVIERKRRSEYETP